MSKTVSDSPTRTQTQSEQFSLLALTGPAIVAGERLLVGDTLQHVEYGTLELRGYGYTNGARGTYVKLVSSNDVDAPEKWSLQRGGPNSVPDAFEDGDLRLGGESA